MNKVYFNRIWKGYDSILTDAAIITYEDISESISDIESKLDIYRKDEQCNGIAHEIGALLSLYKELFLDLQHAKHLQVIIEKTNAYTADKGKMDQATLQGKMDELFCEARIHLSQMAGNITDPIIIGEILDMSIRNDTELMAKINNCPITKMHYDRFKSYHDACIKYLEIYSRKTCLLESDLLEE